MKKAWRRPALFLFSLGLIALGAALALRGWTFYPLSLEERVEHLDRRVLGSSGSLGHGYGVVATVLFLFNMLYLLRRRLVRVEWLGLMQMWLDLHVFTGLAGGLLICFHSAFQLRAMVPVVTASSLALAIVTGAVGFVVHDLGVKGGGPGRSPLDAWRRLHRLAAFLLLAFVPIHVAVAWYYGFRWVLSD